MRFLLCITGTLLVTQAAHSQPQLGNLYHHTNVDGSVSVFAENHGFVPYTLTLMAELTRMSSSLALPATIGLFPSKQPRLIAVFTPEPGQVHSFRYSQRNQFGIYPTQVPDTSYAYGLPFALAVGAALPPYCTSNTQIPGNPHPYFFTLPASTVVRAARVGIVATIRQDVRKTRGATANYVVVFHEDGSYAWYQNLRIGPAPVSIGQRVSEGDLIGCSSAEKSRPPLYFGVEYPGKEKPVDIPVIFKSPENQLLRL